MHSSLFICYTPLHAIIARRIIEEEKITNYSVLFFCATDNKKHRYYYDVISRGSIYSRFEVIKRSPIKDFLFLRNFVKYIQGIGYNCTTTIYTGNIKIIYSRLVLYLMKATKYITFDDGSGNISGDGYFYTNDNILKSLTFRLAAPYLQYSTLRNSMLKHYSIFKLPNVYSNAHYIAMFKPKLDSRDKDALRVLLTSPFSEDGEMSKNCENNLYRKILEKYRIDQILPHPREKRKKITNIKTEYIDTKLIAEDYLNNLSKQYAITAFGLYSTALLTLNECNDIKVVNIDAQLRKPTDWLKRTFLQLGIPTESASLSPNPHETNN